MRTRSDDRRRGGGAATPILAWALAGLAATAGPALPQQKAPPRTAQQPAGPRPAQIDRNGVLILIRGTLLAVQQANETGNYTVLRDLAAPGFREANTAARLGEIFAGQRAQKLDLSGVAALEPQLTLLPQIEPNGHLRMAGFFPSVPQQVEFELLFAPVDGRWRPFGISVDVGSSTPNAPPSPPPPPEAVPKPEVRAAPRPASSGPSRRAGVPADKPSGPEVTPANP